MNSKLLPKFQASIVQTFPYMAKTLQEAIDHGGERLESLAEEILTHFSGLVGGDLDRLVTAFGRMATEMNLLQYKYELQGKYPEVSYEQVQTQIYESPEMADYMLGLACTQFAWKNHFDLWCFFEDEFLRNLSAGQILEVAPGHGLFGLRAMTVLAQATLVGVDISPASVETSRKIAHSYKCDRAKYHVGSALELDKTYIRAFDSFICGELLEHLPEPDKLILQLYGSLRPGGRGYLTAAITAAAPDHIYEFNSPEEVLTMITNCGFAIHSHKCTETRALTKRAKGAPRTLAAIVIRPEEL